MRAWCPRFKWRTLDSRCSHLPFGAPALALNARCEVPCFVLLVAAEKNVVAHVGLLLSSAQPHSTTKHHRKNHGVRSYLWLGGTMPKR
eukprot:1639258-Amphidinium_carterae.1